MERDQYTEHLEEICAEYGMPGFTQVHGPDLHGPIRECEVLVLGSYGVSTPSQPPKVDLKFFNFTQLIELNLVPFFFY